MILIYSVDTVDIEAFKVGDILTEASCGSPNNGITLNVNNGWPCNLCSEKHWTLWYCNDSKYIQLPLGEYL